MCTGEHRISGAGEPKSTKFYILQKIVKLIGCRPIDARNDLILMNNGVALITSFSPFNILLTKVTHQTVDAMNVIPADSQANKSS